jgi:hypothetical protein
VLYRLFVPWWQWRSASATKCVSLKTICDKRVIVTYVTEIVYYEIKQQAQPEKVSWSHNLPQAIRSGVMRILNVRISKGRMVTMVELEETAGG